MTSSQPLQVIKVKRKRDDPPLEELHLYLPSRQHPTSTSQGEYAVNPTHLPHQRPKRRRVAPLIFKRIVFSPPTPEEEGPRAPVPTPATCNFSTTTSAASTTTSTAPTPTPEAAATLTPPIPRPGIPPVRATAEGEELRDPWARNPRPDDSVHAGQTLALVSSGRGATRRFRLHDERMDIDAPCGATKGGHDEGGDGDGDEDGSSTGFVTDVYAIAAGAGGLLAGEGAWVGEVMTREGENGDGGGGGWETWTGLRPWEGAEWEDELDGEEEEGYSDDEEGAS